jgi:magnesium transporter
VNRELAVGVLNGLLWATVVGIVASVWFNDWTLSLVIAIAIVINLITASLVGALLPLFLNRIGIDPALAGGVILTTVTDVVGFLSFLGLAAFFYG